MALQTKTWETGDYSYQSWSNAYKIHLTLTEESTSTENNTSVVYYKFWISNTNNNRFYDNGWTVNVSIGGQDKTVKNFNFYVYPYNVTQTIAEGRVTVTHNSDGSLNMPYNVSIPNIKASNQYAPPAMALSGTWALTTIPRAAKLLSATTFSEATNPTITYSNPAGNSVSSLKVCICNNDWSNVYVDYKDELSKTGSSYTFKLSSTDVAKLLDAAGGGSSLSVKFVLRTTIGGVYKYSELPQTMTIGNVNPIVTASVVDTNATTIALTGDNNKLVKYYSTAYATMSATAQYSAAINLDTYIIRNGNTTGYGTSYTVNNVENNSFTFSVEDSRGYVGTASRAPTMINYVKLTCNIENTKPDASGNMDVRCTGSFFNGSFGSVSNTLTVQCRYKKPDGTYSDWYTMTTTKNGNYYGAYTSFTIANFNYQAVYTFECKATDKLATVSSTPNAVKSTPVFHWSEDDFVFEVPVTFNAGVNNSAVSTTATDQTIDGDLNVTGDLRLKGSGNYGNTLRFGDGNYCYIAEPSDDVMTIKATRINLEANGIYAYGEALKVCKADRWTPALNVANAVSSYSVQEGWYQKVGQCVTIGFQIKATINSGYNSSALTITGVPFTPVYAAFGGGVAHNIYISGGFNFEGWSLGTDGAISARLQPCNNTAAGNLNIASTSSYPSGGGTVTLAGTICYWANS